MPWQDLLSPAQRVQVLALPTSLREYEELYNSIQPTWNLWRRTGPMRTDWASQRNSASCGIQAVRGRRRRSCRQRCSGSSRYR